MGSKGGESNDVGVNPGRGDPLSFCRNCMRQQITDVRGSKYYLGLETVRVDQLRKTWSRLCHVKLDYGKGTIYKLCARGMSIFKCILRLSGLPR